MIQGLMFRACSMGGHVYRTPLCARILMPLCQQVAGVQTVEGKLGLPEKPKRPTPIFVRFAQTLRPKLLAENPDLKPQDVIKIIAKKWKNCDESLKKKLEVQVQKDAAEYAVSLQNYHSTLTKEDQQAIKEAKDKKKEEKAVREQRKILRTLNKPKRPLNAFTLFLQAENAKGTFDNVPFRERMKKASEVWKLAPKETVDAFQAKSLEAMAKYKEDLEAWEDRMVAEGNVDVVFQPRTKSKRGA